MKLLSKVLFVGVMLIASAPFALADPLITGSVNIGGQNGFTTSTISFGNAIALSGTINGTPTAFGTPVNFISGALPYTPGGSFGSGVFLASMGSTNFYLLTEVPTYTADNGQGFSTLDLTGTGFFREAGYADTPVTFDLTSQEAIGSNGGSIMAGSFSASSSTVAPAPEPSSLFLLGTGLLSTAGAAFRKRRTLVASR